MRSRDGISAIDDAIRAGEAIADFLGRRTFEEYASDRMLTSAVERQFEIIGDALSRALRGDATIAARIPEAHEVIGLRNILAHGYDVTEDEIVYDAATSELPALLNKLRELSGLDGAE